ncbi:lipoxygenase homology domain-containing protein 1 [Amia ocellicauda]|uniref:lipoxygenase homology domain-containing protein 1 n=1 Tax=Amia ocellicauda TaxID=2972642 RepID=UPI0034641408
MNTITDVRFNWPIFVLPSQDEMSEVGEIYKVCVSSKPDQVKQTWQLKTIGMKNLETKLAMHLDFNCRFFANAHNYMELPVLLPKQDPQPVVQYRINVYTGDVKKAGFTGEVYLRLQGDQGDTGKRWLARSNNETNTFSQGQVDNFKIKAVNIGKLNQLVIGYRSQRKDRWFLEKIIVAEGEMPTTHHTFMHSDWINAHPKKGDIYEAVIPVKDTTEQRPNPVKESETGKAQQWSMWVKCSPLPEKTADISVIVFGEKQKSSLLKVKNFNNTPFHVCNGEIGDVLKVSFICKSQEKVKHLKLEKLRMKDSVTKQELGFDTADRWLFEENGLESVTELAAGRPDRPPLRDVLYSVKVYTGDLPAAATDAQISCTLFGEKGDTGVRKLTLSSSQLILDKGKVNTFHLKAVDLGMPSRVIVGHGNSGYGAGWYLNKITVQDPGEADAEFVFPCQRWLDSGTGDRWTEREMKLLGKVSSHGQVTADPQGTWDIYISTGAYSSIAEDSEVTLEVCGEKGTSSALSLPGKMLKPGQMYQTTAKIDQRHGSITKIRLRTEGTQAGETWHCRQIKLQNRKTKDIFEFPVLRYLGDRGENTVVELPVIRKDCDFLTVKEYTLSLTTGSSPVSGTDAEIFVTLWGSLGGTGKRKLQRRDDTCFSKGKVDTFTVEAVDIGLLEEVEVEKGRGSNWNLQKIVVKEGIYTEKEAVVLAETWLDNTNRKGTFPVKELQEKTIIESMDVSGKPMKSDGLWNIYLIKPLEQKTDGLSWPFSDLVMIMYGSLGKSKPLFWIPKKSQTNDDAVVYEINLQKNLGELYKVRLGLNSSGAGASRVSLRPFRMQNTDTLDSFICSVNETLPLSSSGDRWLEVPVEWPLKPALHVAVYHITLVSSNVYDQSKPCQVALCVYGQHGDTGDRPLLWPLNTKDQREDTKVFSFVIHTVELGELHSISLSISSKMSVSIHVSEIHLRDSRNNEKVYVFNVNEEFNVGADQPLSAKEFKLSDVINKTDQEKERGSTNKGKADTPAGDEEVVTEFLISTYTGGKIGAGTDASVHVVLFGDQGHSESIALTTPQKKRDPFEKGQVDTFKVLTRSVGKLYKIEIGHDGKKRGSGWFLEKVEIVHSQSNSKFVFLCNRWLAVDEGDKKTTVQLYLEGDIKG